MHTNVRVSMYIRFCSSTLYSRILTRDISILDALHVLLHKGPDAIEDAISPFLKGVTSWIMAYAKGDRTHDKNIPSSRQEVSNWLHHLTWGCQGAATALKTPEHSAQQKLSSLFQATSLSTNAAHAAQSELAGMLGGAHLSGHPSHDIAALHVCAWTAGQTRHETSLAQHDI